MSNTNEQIASLLISEGYAESKAEKRQVFEKAKEGGYLSRVIIPNDMNTLYIYDYSEDRRPISYIEVHNYPDSRQMERITRLI